MGLHQMALVLSCDFKLPHKRSWDVVDGVENARKTLKLMQVLVQEVTRQVMHGDFELLDGTVDQGNKNGLLALHLVQLFPGDLPGLFALQVFPGVLFGAGAGAEGSEGGGLEQVPWHNPPREVHELVLVFIVAAKEGPPVAGSSHETPSVHHSQNVYSEGA